MTSSIYPFQLDGAILASIRLERPPQPPQQYETKVEVYVRVVRDKMPDVLQVNIRALTPEDQVLKLDVTVVGIFKHIEGEPIPNEDEISDFVNKRALHVVWAYIDGIVLTTTAQMGIPPIRLQAPADFNTGMVLEQEAQE